MEECLDKSRNEERERVISHAVEWLRSELENFEYGEIGFMLVIHKGIVKRFRKVYNENVEEVDCSQK